MMLHGKIFFAAEGAANQFADDPDLALRQAQRGGNPVKIIINALAGNIDRHPTIRRRHGQGAFRLQKSMLRRRRLITPRNHMRCSGDGLLHIAPRKLHLAKNIAVRMQVR